jgi:hypothetical protein
MMWAVEDYRMNATSDEQSDRATMDVFHPIHFSVHQQIYARNILGSNPHAC